jgi:predicted nucleic acid-binding protein
MPSTRAIVFDSHAVLKWMQKEPGFAKVKSLIAACRLESLEGFMNQINLGEVYYKAIRARGLERAKELLQNFQRLPIRIVLPDSELICKAAEIKADHSVSYADCFVAATAMRFHATVLTGDPELEKLDRIVTVEWV